MSKPIKLSELHRRLDGEVSEPLTVDGLHEAIDDDHRLEELRRQDEKLLLAIKVEAAQKMLDEAKKRLDDHER